MVGVSPMSSRIKTKLKGLAPSLLTLTNLLSVAADPTGPEIDNGLKPAWRLRKHGPLGFAAQKAPLIPTLYAIAAVRLFLRS